jgi:RNA polymerase sigma-70 factor, ECF subfamily
MTTTWTLLHAARLRGCRNVVGAAGAQPLARAAGPMGEMQADIQQLLQRRMFDEALQQLVEGYQHKVFRMAVAMLKDAGRAEEVTQDIFLKVWRALPSYDGRALVSTWVYAIARNACLSAVRAESYRRTEPLENVAEPASPIPQGGDVDWDRLLARLPEVQRQVVALYYFEDRGVKDVAERLGLAVGTVKSHLFRARQALAGMLE